MNDFKKIHIGSLIEKRWKEMNISMTRVCHFFKLDEELILKMFQLESIETELLVKWSKLLEYDYFRLYSQHLLLYSPNASTNLRKKSSPSSLPQFRKSIYTQEIIQFILALIQSGEKTKQQVITDYRIPKTTLYKWITKYQNNL